MGTQEFITICTEEEASVHTDDMNRLPLCYKQYSSEEAEKILNEAKGWEILYTWSQGSDYGYSMSNSDSGSHTEEIKANHILVENGSFAGIVMRSEGSAFNKRMEVYDDLTTALVRNYKGEPLLCARGGTSFSSDDHESWDTFQYYLQPKATATEHLKQEKQ